MFRLCLALGVNHPDSLLAGMTWEQICQWQAYYNAEPWGEMRADQRAQAQTMWLNSQMVFEQHNLPDLAYPYFPTEDDWIAQKRLLDQRKRELSQRRDETGGFAGG